MGFERKLVALSALKPDIAGLSEVACCDPNFRCSQAITLLLITYVDAFSMGLVWLYR
jgi:hypothetical protein